MAQTYSQLQAQIAALQLEAEKTRRAELAEVIAKMRVAIDAYGIQSEDLFGGKSRKTAKTGRMAGHYPSAKSKFKLDQTPKFADEKGNTWVGRGPHPRWLREALGTGKRLSEFAIAKRKGSDTNPSPSTGSSTTAGKAKTKEGKQPVAVKYRDEAGNSWTGRGSQPKWLKAALADDKALDQFLV